MNWNICNFSTHHLFCRNCIIRSKFQRERNETNDIHSIHILFLNLNIFTFPSLHFLRVSILILKIHGIIIYQRLKSSSKCIAWSNFLRALTLFSVCSLVYDFVSRTSHKVELISPWNLDVILNTSKRNSAFCCFPKFGLLKGASRC